jgi:hypothetical protein
MRQFAVGHVEQVMVSIAKILRFSLQFNGATPVTYRCIRRSRVKACDQEGGEKYPSKIHANSLAGVCQTKRQRGSLFFKTLRYKRECFWGEGNAVKAPEIRENHLQIIDL